MLIIEKLIVKISLRWNKRISITIDIAGDIISVIIMIMI